MTVAVDELVDVAGVSTHYVAAGLHHQGTPVVLIHGGAWGESAVTTWGDTVAALGTQRPVVAYDVPGFGHSAKLVDLADPLGFMARHLGALVTALGFDAVDLIGLSMGGSVALSALTARPPLLTARSLVLVSAGGAPIPADVRSNLAAFDGTTESMRAQIGLAFADPAWRLDDAFVARRVEAALLPGAYEAFAALGIRSPRPSASPVPSDLSLLRQPTLVVAGGRDAIKPAGWAAPFVAGLPDARLHVEADAGHCPHLERPESFRAVVTGFLDAISDSDAPRRNEA